MKVSSWLLCLSIFAITFPLVLNAQTLVSAKPPAYPLEAKAAGIDGSVVLKGTISKEGKMENLRVLSGPTELRQAAIDAVMRWTYKPYKHFGRLVEIDTTVTVNFTMGSGTQKATEQAKAQTELAKSTQPSPSPDNSQSLALKQ